MAGIPNNSKDFLKSAPYTLEIKDRVGFFKAHAAGLEELVNLSGGIPVNVTGYSIEIEAMSEQVVLVRIKCDQYYTTRTIDFEDKVITNDLMRVIEKNQGVGLSLLVNQIITATVKGFKSLEVHAAGGIGWTSDWDGHSFWAKTGYTMNKEGIAKFDAWLKEHGLDKTTPFDLANDKIQGGHDLWYDEGFDWYGNFDLDSDSKNRQLLRKYLNKRGLSVNI
jgi:hypothetical protein